MGQLVNPGRGFSDKADFFRRDVDTLNHLLPRGRTVSGRLKIRRFGVNALSQNLPGDIAPEHIVVAALHRAAPPAYSERNSGSDVMECSSPLMIQQTACHRHPWARPPTADILGALFVYGNRQCLLPRVGITYQEQRTKTPPKRGLRGSRWGASSQGVLSGKRMTKPSRFGIRTFGSVSAFISSFSPMSLFSARM